jgi:hypothetical protein
MLKPQKNTSSFVITHEPAPKPMCPTARMKHEQDGVAPTDADAQRALAWQDRGKPQAEIVFDDAVPKQTKSNQARFRRASYRREKG